VSVGEENNSEEFCLPRYNVLCSVAVGIATGHGLGDQVVGVRIPMGANISTSPCSPDRIWGPSSFLSNG
jgi:hypothetical protein